jgi:hypothetical protein
MADTALARAEAMVLARQRLRAHLHKVAKLAGQGNVPAARMMMDAAMSDLDDIATLVSDAEEGDRA